MVRLGKNWLKRGVAWFLGISLLGNVYTDVMAENSGESAVNWVSLYGGAGTSSVSCDSVNDVRRLTDGDMAAAGAFDGSEGGVEGQKGMTDAAFLLYDKSGVLKKQILFGGTKEDYFNKVLDAAYGGYVAIGASESADGDLAGIVKGGYDGLAVRFDAECVSAKTVAFGGSGEDELKDIVNATDGGYVAVGYTYSNDGDLAGIKATAEKDALIIKLNAELEVEWINVAGHEDESGVLDEFTSVAICADGSFITAGYRQTGEAGKDILVVKYAEDGTKLWEKTYGGTGDESASCIVAALHKSSTNRTVPVADLQDGFVVAGTMESVDGMFEEGQISKEKAFLMKVGNAGEIVFYDMLENSAGSTGKKVIAVSDGYVLTGTYQGNDMDFDGMPVFGGNDFFVARYSAEGEFLKMSVFGSDGDDSVKGLIEGGADDYILYGNTASEDFYGQAVRNTYDGFLMSISTSSLSGPKPDTPSEPESEEVNVTEFEHLWKVNVGGSDEDSVNTLAVLDSGHIVVGGETYSNDMDFEGMHKGQSSAFVNEYDEKGNFIRSIVFGGENSDTTAYVKTLDACADGGYFAAGCYYEHTAEEPSGDFASLKSEGSVHGLTDCFLIKYDADGSQKWMINFSGSNYDMMRQVRALDDGGCVVLIETNSSDGDMEGQQIGLYDLVLVRYDDEGNRQWQCVLGGSDTETTGFGLDILEDGNYVIGGSLALADGVFSDVEQYGDIYDLFVACVNVDGEILWTKSYGGNKNDYCYGVLATSDGGFMMTGSTKSTTDNFELSGTSYDNAYVLKCNKAGESEWIDVIKSSESSRGSSIIETQNGYVILGSSYGTDYDFANLNKGSKDAFTVEYSKDGERSAVKVIGGILVDDGRQIVLSEGKNVTVLVSGNSVNGDMQELNRGKSDGTLIRYQILVEENPQGTDSGQEDDNMAEEPQGDVLEQEGQIQENDKKEETEKSEKAPNTGDQTYIQKWSFLLISATAVVVVILFLKRRKRL